LGIFGGLHYNGNSKKSNIVVVSEKIQTCKFEINKNNPKRSIKIERDDDLQAKHDSSEHIIYLNGIIKVKSISIMTFCAHSCNSNMRTGSSKICLSLHHVSRKILQKDKTEEGLNKLNRSNHIFSLLARDI
jgi:hypothetical protein